MLKGEAGVFHVVLSQHVGDKMSSSSIHWNVRILAALAATFVGSAASADQAPPENTGGKLEEVVVTAQFVRQNLQETPVAITAISAADLQARGHQSVQDIAAQAPNVTLSAGGQYSGPALVGFIRGVGQLDFSPAFEPGVGLYVDDVYYATMTGSVLDLLDLDRVEVARGPQGTLAGKNSIGGSIKMYSKKPDENSDGYIEAGYGSYNAVTVRGASNFTLVPEHLFMRISGVSRARDGYITRLDYVCSHRATTDAAQAAVIALLPSWQENPSCVLGHEGSVRYTAGRAALRWMPSDSFEANLAIDAVSDVSEPPPNVMLGAGPTIAPVMFPAIAPGNLLYDWVGAFPFPTVPMPGCLFVAYGSNSCDPMSPNDPYVNYSPYEDPRTHMIVTPNQKVSAWGAALNLDWKFGEGLDLQSITAYRKYDSGWGNDAGATPVALQMLYQTLHHDQTSQEFRLNGKTGSMLDYTVGAFYMDQTTTWDARVDLPYVGFDFLHGPDPTDAKNWAAFAHGIFHLTDQFDISAGVRYSDDEKTYTFHRHNPDGSAILPCTGPLGDPANPPNCLISTINGVSSTFKGTRTDYRAALSYQWTDAVMTYLQYSTGYKGGGINPRPFYNVQAVSFRPETLDAFELGLKSEIGNQLRLNVALFTNKYKDVQIQHTNCTAEFGALFGIPCLAPLNSGDADVKGGEVELFWRPVGGLQVDASYSYLDFKFTSLDPNASACAACVTPYTPKTKWAVGAQYEIGLAGGATLTPRVDASYQAKVFTDVTNSAIGEIDSYTLLNAQIAWRGAKDDWTLLLEGRNLTDELYYTTKTNQIDSGAGSAYGAPALPRTVMFTVQHNF
jgi:iron complex outermembrane receptor protein